MVTIAKIIFVYLFVTVRSCQASNIICKDGTYEKTLELDINKTTEYIVKYEGNKDKYPVKVIVSSPFSTKEHPLLIVAQEQNSITSWQVPYVANPLKNTIKYSTVGHILCPASNTAYTTVPVNEISPSILRPNLTSNPSITIISTTDTTYRFNVTAYVQKDFFLKNNLAYSTLVSPCQSMYYFYSFLDEGNEAIDSGAVLVEASSKSRECMLISVQNSTCPVFDLENNIKFQSNWQTMNLKAGIVATKRDYPNGFYIVMVVTQDNSVCTNIPDILYLETNKAKNVTIKVSNISTTEDQIYIVISTVGIFIAIPIICTIINYVYLRRRNSRIIISSENDAIVGRRNSRTVNFSENEVLVDEAETTEPELEADTGIETEAETETETETIRSNYIWHIWIVALFYTPPVLNLVLTFLGIFHKTGNQDLCYYNFLCARPWGYITDFNHILSNIGYVFFGLSFIFITYVKQIVERSRSNEMGLPRPYGMFYALGFASIMEGIMSACYHICPKTSNFQFDTSFMYVMIVLMIVHMYENRHSSGESNGRGYAVFGILAGAATICTIALGTGEQLYFWIIIGMIQISVLLVLTWKIDKSLFQNLFDGGQRMNLTKLQICNIVLWIMINVVNWSLVAWVIYKRSGLAIYLLIVFIANGICYTIYYIIMKIYNGESILVFTWIHIILAIISWIIAIYFFAKNVTSWENSPAESRNINQECVLVKYYDNHDIWHFISSVALFFTFIVLLTLDEDLAQISRTAIPPFHRV